MKPICRLVLLSAILFAGTVAGQDCIDTEFSYEYPTCPSGKSEVYTQLFKAPMEYFSKCCIPGSADDATQKLFAKACGFTSCVTKSEAKRLGNNLCDTYYDRRFFIGGQETKFVDTVQDQCEINNWGTKEVGTQSLCCAEEGMDVLLTTLYGSEKYEFPHFVRLGKNGCGGTVYNKRWILTAGHCVTYENNKWYAQGLIQKTDTDYWNDHVGTARINIDLENAYTENNYKVVDIKIHPNCSRLKPLTDALYNDIALVKVDRDIIFNEKVKALRIPEKGFKPLDHGTHAILAGFGMTDTLIYPRKLQKTNVPIRSTDEFLKYYMPGMMPYKDQMLFVGGIFQGDVQPRVGQGDSGGPAICRDGNGMAILCGITSFSTDQKKCLDNLDEFSCIPSGYVDVGYFRDWIHSVAGDQKGVKFLEQPLFGSVVPSNKYPSQVHVTSSDGEACGGTLIAEDVVLTTGNCVATAEMVGRAGLQVTTGLRDLEGNGGKSFGVKDIAIMGGYGVAGGKRKKRIVSTVLESWRQGKLNDNAIMKDPYYNNNIALLSLDGRAGAKNVAKLASKTASEGASGMEISFPLKTKSQAERKRHLTQREFKILSISDCQKRLDRLSVIGYNIKLQNTHILCGVEKYSGGSMCDRELGGGLFCKENGEDVLCGVQSFRTCEFNVPNAFIDVANLQDIWIGEAMKRLQRIS